MLWSETSAYYCPRCHLRYGALPDVAGYVRCLQCGEGRSDGFNQIDRYTFQCIVCGARIGVVLDGQPMCPNSCSSSRKRGTP
ncbi:hypothetical protein HY635_04155 [Candidatus Uhrbacteria bacterium]|nr:hypothetical protein [Candidatus Uhrbacteria bacterium]